MAVALLALFVALGGTGYAVTKINGKNLKDRSVPAKKLKKDQLTGTEINESKLGKVPAAEQADHAAAADHATASDNATTAANATEAAHAAAADTATDANKLGGVPAPLVNAANSATAATCDPDTSDLFGTVCANVNLGLPAKSHVLVIASGDWWGTSGAQATCDLRHDGTSGQSVNLGQATATHNSAANAAPWSVTALFLNVDTGAQGFDIHCVENTTNMHLAHIKIVAVRLAAVLPTLVLP